MRRVCVVCEGQTEETFVRDVLAPAFYHLDLNLIPEMIETSPGHKGGSLNYDRVRRHLRNRLRQNSAPVVTTLFDLYRLDIRFPGFNASLEQADLPRRLRILKQSLHDDIVKEAKCDPKNFIPFIQPYEFEALLFSDVPTLISVEQGWIGAIGALTSARNTAATPEHINDRPETKPAAHLQRELRNPSYRKNRHGPIAAKKIGLAKIEAECSFFSEWLTQLRGLAPQ